MVPRDAETEQQLFDRFVQQQRDSLRRSYDEYDQLVDLVCCIELWLEYNYGAANEENAAAKLLYFDPYPRGPEDAGAYGPDFTALFENGYGLVGEVKRQLTDRRDGLERSLGQLHKYATEDFPFRDCDRNSPQVVPERKDLLLILSMENVVRALNLISEARAQGQYSVADQPIVVGQYPDEQRGPDEHWWWIFNWDDIEGNSQFCDANVLGEQPVSSDSAALDLNGHFCGDEHVAMRVSRSAHGQRKAEVCFYSDEPPPVYALSVKVWRYIHTDLVHRLPEADKDRWVRERTVNTQIHVPDMIQDLSNQMPIGVIRRGWIQGALDLLCELDWARRTDADTYCLDFTRPQRMGAHDEYFINRLAKTRARERLSEHEEQAPSDIDDDQPRLPELQGA